MKIITSFLLGGITGGLTVFLLLNNSSPTLSEMTITSSNNARVTGENLTVVTKRNEVQALASFETDRAGIYTNQITINRKELQYKNSLSGQIGYMTASETLFVDLGYSYEKFLVSAKSVILLSCKKLNTVWGLEVSLDSDIFYHSYINY